MKLEKKPLELIWRVVLTAKLVNIDNVIIEEGRIRGIDENRTVVLFHEDEDITLDVGSLGITRIDTLLSRLNLVMGRDDFNVDVKVDDTKGFIRSLTMKAKGTRVEYRCADPAHVAAPRVINDVMQAKVMLPQPDAVLLQDGAKAMGNAELVTIKNVKDEVMFELEDVNGDVFDRVFAKGVQHEFSHKYPVRTILALLKNGGEFEIGQKGMLKVVNEELGVLILPRV